MVTIEIGKGAVTKLNYIEPLVWSAEFGQQLEWFNKHPNTAILIAEKTLFHNGGVPIRYFLIPSNTKVRFSVRGDSGDRVKYRVYFLADHEPPATEELFEVPPDHTGRESAPEVAFRREFGAADPEITIV